MTKSKVRRAGFFLLLVSVLFTPTKAWSGPPPLPVPTTLNASHQLFFFWDLRNRESFFQIYNTSSTAARVFIQIFNVADYCRESNFFDTFTGFDTYVYNLRNLATNDGKSEPFPVANNGYGLIAVTLSKEGTDPDVRIDPILIGNFRIVDETGYEYRVNAAAFPPLSSPFIIPTTDRYSFNFNDVDGSSFSDVVGMPIHFGYDINTFTGPPVVFAGGPIGIVFDADLFDENENFTDCPHVAFGCAFQHSAFQDQLDDYESTHGETATPGFDLGINSAIPNSRDEDKICVGVDSKGRLTLTTQFIFVPPAHFFVGFIGLNNDDGTGSMNPFTASPP